MMLWLGALYVLAVTIVGWVCRYNLGGILSDYFFFFRCDRIMQNARGGVQCVNFSFGGADEHPE